MARKKGEIFPSDHRRYFLVMEDILDCDKLDRCSADVFRFYIRVLAMLNRSKSKDGNIRLNRSSLRVCAGRTKLKAALEIAKSGAELGLFSLSHGGEVEVMSRPCGGDVTVIHVPKWAKIQGLSPPPNPNPNPNPIVPPSQDGLLLAERLGKTITKIQPNRRQPVSQVAWARVYDRTLAVKGRTVESVTSQLRWLMGVNQQQGRYATKVFSAEAHHEKYDDIENRMLRLAAGSGDDGGKAEADRKRLIVEQRQAEEQRLRDEDRARAIASPAGNVTDLSQYVDKVRLGGEGH